jgi:hypothetical protein
VNIPDSAGWPASTRRFIQARAVRTASETSKTRPSASQPSRKPTLMRKSRRRPRARDNRIIFSLRRRRSSGHLPFAFIPASRDSRSAFSRLWFSWNSGSLGSPIITEETSAKSTGLRTMVWRLSSLGAACIHEDFCGRLRAPHAAPRLVSACPHASGNHLDCCGRSPNVRSGKPNVKPARISFTG